jgi:hypothetical protein
VRGRRRDDPSRGTVGVEDQAHVALTVDGRERLRALQAHLLTDGHQHADGRVRHTSLAEKADAFDDRGESGFGIRPEDRLAAGRHLPPLDHRHDPATGLDRVHV